MKITKRQLKRIIKEEKQKLLHEAGRPDGRTHPSKVVPGKKWEPTGASVEQTDLHMSGRNQNVMEQLHTAIDALIDALGNEEAHQELLGIVEEWDTETY